MVTRDELRQRGLRSYERGRLRVAARVAWYVIPTALVCVCATGAGEACTCLGLLLLGLALYLRWRDRRGASAVSAGLVAGLLPLVVGLVLGSVSPACVGAPFWSLCTAVCLTVGLPSGIWLGLRAARGQFGILGALTAASVAILAASLGCAGLGVAGIAGSTLGLAIGSGLALLPARVS